MLLLNRARNRSSRRLGNHCFRTRKSRVGSSAFVTNILEPINRQEGDQLTVSDLIENGMKGGAIPMGTAAYENVALR